MSAEPMRGPDERDLARQDSPEVLPGALNAKQVREDAAKAAARGGQD